MHFLLQSKKIFCAVVLLFCSTAMFAQATFKNGVRIGRIKVKVSAEAATTFSNPSARLSKGISTGIQTFDAVAKSAQTKKMYRLFPYDAKNESKLRKHNLHLWYVLEIDESVDPNDAVKKFKSVKEVTHAETEHERILAPYQVKPYVPSATATATLPFNDPMLKDQWHYHNTNQGGSWNSTADINLFNAWLKTTGSKDVIVSVHDVGVDVSHKDLVNNIWTNQVELNGSDGVDDDGNGYVDDIHGWNFAKRSGNIDPEYHATHVAGTIAAVNNNGIGVSGIAGGNGSGNGAKVMSMQILDGGSVEESYIYAANNGAVISQNSWGYTASDYYDQSVLDAIDYFIAEAGDYNGSPMKGGIVIFAAGNSSDNGQWYPAYYPHVLAVASVGPEWKIASYSNYGDWVDISAPGGDEDTYGTTAGVLSTVPSNGYAYLQGTSMACPHVSGIAALALANRKKQMTNTELWNNLVTGVVNIDQYNPDYVGSLGSGAIDAVLAIQNNLAIAPVAITDLTVTGVSQEFATLSWTVPTDGDDGKPFSFQLYYNTAPITSANLASSKIIQIKNEKAAGSTYAYEIDGLLGLTTYYFAIISTDRWGNVSSLSNMPTITTNEGPSVAVDDQSQRIDLAIDATASSTATHNITILNNASGILRWNHLMRHKSTSLSFSSTSIKYPSAPSTTKPASITRRAANDKVGKWKKANSTVQVTPSGFTSVEFDYNDYATNLIGDTDVSLPNSAVAQFHVSQAEGFNLTNAQFYLKHDPAKGNVIMEVYQGDAPIKDNLIYTQEFSNYSKDEQWAYITLDEQLYFEQGTTFWIAFHVPGGNQYPLGIGYENDPAYSTYCYYSNDLGNQWVTLENALGSTDFAWSMIAASYDPFLGTYLTLDPNSGEISGNESEATVLTADGSAMVNGSYNADLIITSNDAQNKELKIPVTLTVSRHQPDIKHIDIADFGGVFVGTSKSMDIVLDNQGYGNFNSPTFTVNGTQFQINNNSLPYQIAARDQGIVTVTFLPTVPGNANDILTVTDGNLTYQIPLFAVGVETSKIVVTPQTQLIDSVVIGDVINAKLTVANSGKYPLKYFVPGYDTKGISDNWPSTYHKYGYKVRGISDTVAYRFQDISSTGVDITSSVTSFSSYYALDMGFQFPYYGDKMSTIYIAGYGYTTFDNSIAPVNMPSLGVNEWNPKGFISPIGYYWGYSSQGKVHYQVEADRVIIQYSNVTDGYNGELTAQMVLFSNGNIRFYYDNVDNYYNLSGLTILINNYEQDDGILIQGYDSDYNQHTISISDGSAIGFDYPGPNIITQIDNASGVVSPGDSAIVNITLNASSLVEGLINRYVNIISNDPSNPQDEPLIQLDVTSGGTAVAQLSTDTIAFGNVFQGAVKSIPFVIKNPGTANVNIDTMVFKNGSFVLTGNSHTSIAPRLYGNHSISIPTSDLATLEDWLSINYADGTYDTIYVTGNVIDAPAIVVDTTLLWQTLNYGDTVSIPFNIQNTGKGPLEITLTGDQWLTYGAPLDAKINADYVYEKHNNGSFYQWLDIRKTGTKLPNLKDLEKSQYWRTLTLPFPIQVYGESFSEIKVGDNGIISLNGDPDVMFFNDNVPTKIYNGEFVMPYWAFTSFDSTDYASYNPGIFYQYDDDKIIITWNAMVNNFSMGDPMSAQVIFYKNGTMKFQYKKEGDGNDLTSQFAVIGMQKDTTTGFAISQNLRLDYGSSGNLAYVLMPADKYLVPANSTMTGAINIDARNTYGGTYDQTLKIQTNAPGSESLKKPVELMVLGNAQFSPPDTIDFGGKLVQALDQWGDMVTYYIDTTLTNTGTAPMQITYAQMYDGSQSLGLQIWALVPNWFGAEQWQWADLSTLYSPWGTPTTLTINPSDELKVRATFEPTSPGNYADSVLFTTSLGHFTINLKGKAYNPPVLAIDSSSVAVTLNTASETIDRIIAFDNLNGQSDLKYNLSIDYGRASTTGSSKEKNSSATANMLQKFSGDVSIQPIAKANSAYAKTISYITKDIPDTFVGNGGAAPITIATQYNAGTQGFNLSHVETWLRTEVLSSVEVDVEIRAGGTSIIDAVKIAQGSLTVTGSGNDQSGAYRQIALDNPASIYPNENFYVIISYPLGLSYPQGAVTDASVVSNRYLYYDEGSWMDLQTVSGLTNVGWMMFVGEDTQASTAWVTITSNISGAVAAGNASSINLHFDGTIAQRGDQTATVILTTNDPVTSTVHIPVSLHLNDAPKFTNVPDPIVVAENDTLVLKINVSDPEGNTFTVTPAQSYTDINYSFDGSVMTLTFTPDYGTAGNYIYTFTAKDQYDAERQLALNVEVVHTNRAPVYVAATKTININGDGSLNLFALSDYFTDPDGDDVTYTLTSSSDSVEIYTSQSSFMLKSSAKTISDAKLFFSVLDSHGAAVKDTLTLNVNIILAVEEAKTKGVNIYPNPVQNSLHIKLSGEWMGYIQFQMVDATGKQVLVFSKDVQQETTSFDTSTLNRGFYLLQLRAKNRQAVIKLIKE